MSDKERIDIFFIFLRKMRDDCCKTGVWFPIVFLLLFTTGLMMVCSNESWLRIEYPREDSAWFFTAGRSWMSGLKPYLDFSDSKGPLLWLIYGLGYLISPHTMHGLFLFEVLFYFGTFVCLYFSAKIFLKSEGKSLLASCLMAFIFFQPWLHQEIRVEDYNQLFYSLTLLSVVKILISDNLKKRYFILLGLSAGCCLFTKFNSTLILTAPSFVVFLYVIRNFGLKTALQKLGWWLTGFLIITLPFFIYFYLNGILSNFIGEYFLTTSVTVNTIYGWGGESFFERWPFNLYSLIGFDQARNIGFKIALFGICLLPLRLYRNNWFRATISIWFVAAVLLSTIVWFRHYMFSLSVMSLFMMVTWLSFVPALSKPFVTLCGGLIIAINGLLLNHFEFKPVERAKVETAAKEKVDILIGDFIKENDRHPTIAYLYLCDSGFGMKNEVVAGSKYWSFQAGFTYEMALEHISEIFRKHPDVVVVERNEKEIRDSLERHGYVEIREKYLKDLDRDEYFIQPIYVRF